MSALIDTSVFCGHWPFRNLAPLDPHGLKEHLKRRGVTQAWVAPTEAVLYPDPMEGNEPLLSAVSDDAFFVSLAVIDVTLATYLEDAAACLKRWRCRGFKLTPNYHSYALSDTRVEKLLALAADANVPVCVQIRMMDERSHHRLMQVPCVPPESIAALAAAHPGNRFLACGAFHSDLKTLKNAAGNLWAEISSVESGNALVNAVAIFGDEKIVFGSHSPFYYFEGVAGKLNVGSELTAETLRRVCELNAVALLGAAR